MVADGTLITPIGADSHQKSAEIRVHLRGAPGPSVQFWNSCEQTSMLGSGTKCMVLSLIAREHADQAGDRLETSWHSISRFFQPR